MIKSISRAKEIITGGAERMGFPVRRILLFGSRARGEARANSDWDFFVMIEEDKRV